MKFIDVSESWLNYHKVNIEYYTFLMYKGKVKLLNIYFKDKKIDEINMLDIHNFLTYLSYDKNLSKSTIQKYKVTLNQIYIFAIIRGYTENNPCIYVKLPKAKPKKIIKPLNEYEIKTVINNADTHFGFYPLFLIFTGLRREEALALTKNDIDIENKKIYVNKVLIFKGKKTEIRPYLKNGEDRIVSMPNIIVDKLKKMNYNNYLFCDENENVYNTHKIRNRWKRYLKSTGINITQHQCRHTYASMLYKSGVDVKTAQQLLGHKTLQLTLDTYTHLDNLYKNKNIDKFNSYINENIYYT